MKRTIYETQDKIYRILEILDDHFSVNDLKGDCYNPEVNLDMDPKQLAKEEKDFEQLVEREGVFGYVLEKWNAQAGAGYEHIDSCWGFVSQYNPKEEQFNHYIVDELKGQIK